jgi:predicted enzyme related to lactoylglutathione lyase
MKHNIVGWFEIPVSDMDRAVKFYESVLGLKLEVHDLGNLKMALFPSDSNLPGAPGSLVFHDKFYKPSENGVLIYITSPSGDLDGDMKKVEDAGGKVIIPRRQVSDVFGFMAVFLDSEGNRVALHSKT